MLGIAEALIVIDIAKLPFHPQFPHFIHANIHDQTFHEDLQAPDIQLFNDPFQHLVVLRGGRNDQGIGGLIRRDYHLPRKLDPLSRFLFRLGLGGYVRQHLGHLLRVGIPQVVDVDLPLSHWRDNVQITDDPFDICGILRVGHQHDGVGSFIGDDLDNPFPCRGCGTATTSSSGRQLLAHRLLLEYGFQLRRQGLRVGVLKGNDR